jgi:hypothetical protein
LHAPRIAAREAKANSSWKTMIRATYVKLAGLARELFKRGNFNLQTSGTRIFDNPLQLATGRVINPFLPTLGTNACSHPTNDHYPAANVGAESRCANGFGASAQRTKVVTHIFLFVR